MGKTDPLLPCPHCGSMMRAGSLKRHTPLCIKNPAAFTRYCEVLTSAPGSRQGITCGRYVELSNDDKTLPTVITLRRLAGKAKWPDVLAVFGLESPPLEVQRSQCMHCGKFISGGKMAGHLQECKALQPKAPPPPKPPRKAMNVLVPRKPMNVLVPRKPRTVPPPQTCEQCGAQRINMERHVCPEDPAVVAWLARVLPDPADPGRMITCREYRDLPDKAIAQNIIDKAYGSWRGLAARYGLEVRAQRRTIDGKPKLDAATLAELRRLAIELHDDGHGPSHGEFTIYATGPAMGTAGLKKLFGTWAAVLEAAGLRHGSHSYYVRAANARRKAHEAARGPRGPVASKYERGDEAIPREPVGLTVCDKPRALPSGGIAWVIR